MTMELTPEDAKGISPIDEAFLIENAWSDPAAFSQLYLAYLHPIYRYISSKVGERGESEDLTAQVFLEALEGLPHYRRDGHIAAWLFSIARHKVADHYRTRRSFLPIENAYEELTGASDTLSTLIQIEEAQRISVLIHNLDYQEQELLRLRFIAGLNYKEIARLIHRNTEGTKKQVYRLLARLRQQLEHYHD
jgi:RNA polymerase sigma-70 factor (ECF subfamily)